jgi:hypothetical protein
MAKKPFPLRRSSTPGIWYQKRGDLSNEYIERSFLSFMSSILNGV